LASTLSIAGCAVNSYCGKPLGADWASYRVFHRRNVFTPSL
jgi:hypothetical protein